MRKVQRLLAALDAIANALSQRPQALALIGLGSTGQELNRMDEYSDLDFFVIVRPGSKQAFLDDLTWLEAAGRIDFAFLNTVDGYKVLFENGVFAEFAVFEVAELSRIPYTPGRVIWKADDFDEKLATQPPPLPQPEARSTAWLLGEALTNCYVGLQRFHRGEKLSAMRFVQVYAVDRILELIATSFPASQGQPDAFVPERRFEARFPQLAPQLRQFVQGYEATPASARAIVEFLDRHYEVNPALKAAILELC